MRKNEAFGAGFCRSGLTIITILFSTLGVSGQEKTSPPFRPGSTTLVVLPDTEGYPAKRPGTFHTMMKWVADQRDDRNIAGILHVGDVTNNNTRAEWKVARACFDHVEGKLPYVLAAGNHDYDHTPGRLTYMNEVFKVGELKKKSEFGGVFEAGKLENHYQLIGIGGRRWLVLSLEMGPRKAVVEWGNEVLERHKNDPAIVLTHGYLYYDNQRYDHRLGKQRATPYNFYGEGADGEQLWDQLVKRHPNVMMVVCGHVSSAYLGYRADEGDFGNVVHQMMVDYEKLRGGGMGFLRLLEFLPDNETVQVRTYSPVTGGKNPRGSKLEEFVFKLQPATRSYRKDPAVTPSEALSRAPRNRYRFGGPSDKREVLDSLGDQNGKLTEGAFLDGEGRLVLSGDGAVELPQGLIEGKTDMSFELWFTPTAEKYSWSAPVRFGSSDDWLTYVFRNLTTHRAEIAVDRHNEDIQQGVPAKPGRMMHVVVTYDADGADSKALLSYYRDGILRGTMPTSLKLSDVTEKQNRIGPFAGIFNEFRIYDFALSAAEVGGSYNAGSEKLVVAKPGDGAK